MTDIEIKITETSGGYVADLIGLPGSPPIGDGATREMAVASLFFRLMFDPLYRDRIVEIADRFSCKLSIDGVLYEPLKGSASR